MTYEISNYNLHKLNCEGPYGDWLLILNINPYYCINPMLSELY